MCRYTCLVTKACSACDPRRSGQCPHHNMYMQGVHSALSSLRMQDRQCQHLCLTLPHSYSLVACCLGQMEDTSSTTTILLCSRMLQLGTATPKICLAAHQEQALPAWSGRRLRVGCHYNHGKQRAHLQVMLGSQGSAKRIAQQRQLLEATETRHDVGRPPHLHAAMAIPGQKPSPMFKEPSERPGQPQNIVTACHFHGPPLEIQQICI